jgi:hypothetical protein
MKAHQYFGENGSFPVSSHPEGNCSFLRVGYPLGGGSHGAIGLEWRWPANEFFRHQHRPSLASPLSQILSDGTSTSIYGMDRLYSEVGIIRSWYTNDLLGSVRAITSNAGIASAVANYDPYGGLQGSAIGSFGFTGELQQRGRCLPGIRTKGWRKRRIASIITPTGIATRCC